MHGKFELHRSAGPTAGGSPATGFDLRDQPAPVPVRPAPVEKRSGDLGWAALLEACLADLKTAIERGDTARPPLLDKAIEDFALIERGTIRQGSRRAQQALRVGRLSLARHLITRHLSQPSLSPAMVAGLLGVSVRYVHLLFEATGTSLSDTVTAERMRLSRQILSESPERPIAEIAHACGFASLATFYRVFNTAHGLPPGEFRAQGGAPASAASAPADRLEAADLTIK